MSHLPEEFYDPALIGQTHEHLYNPFLAMSRLFRKMAPGGYVFASTPQMNRPHSTPVHFFHYTPMGLAICMLQAGFEVLESEQFGSFDYEWIVLQEHRWPDYLELAKKLGTAPLSTLVQIQIKHGSLYVNSYQFLINASFFIEASQ